MLLTNIKVFAFQGFYCRIIEYKYLINIVFHYRLKKHMKAWGAKYQSCSQLISVDAIICEKARHFLLLNNVQNIVLNVETKNVLFLNLII